MTVLVLSAFRAFLAIVLSTGSGSIQLDGRVRLGVPKETLAAIHDARAPTALSPEFRAD